MVIQTEISDRYFQMNVQSEPATLSNHWTMWVANDKVEIFKQKFKIWKTCVCHHELDSFPILKDFPDEINDGINKCNFFLYNIMECVNI